MLIHWIWLAQLPDVTLHQKLQLLQHFPDAEDLFFADDAKLSELEPKLRDALSNKDLTEARKIENKCLQRKIDLLPITDSAYPVRLRNIPDPPILLYCKGSLPDLTEKPIIGIVGTRKATPYGIASTKKLSRQIAVCGGLVISGGAAGIDTAAMQGAMETGNPVLCVLGCGVDVAYPVKNRQLFDQTAKNGCLISEYPPGDTPERWHFPQRNRIISGMANGVLVTEAPERSGALITARQALEQGRDVFVIPGNIDVETSAGSNGLLQDGAAAVLSGWDVVKTYESQYPNTVADRPLGLLQPEKPADIPKVAQAEKLPTDKKDIDILPKTSYIGKETNRQTLSAEEQQILDLLTEDPQSVDGVLARLDMPSARALSLLTKLALKGSVINHPGRLVSVRTGRK